MFQPMKIGMDPRLTQLPQIKPNKNGGMFGGADWGSAVAAALAGFSAGGGNPAAQMALQALHGNRLQKQRMQQDEQSYQRQRTDGIADYETKQQIEAKYARPQVSDFERMAALAGVQPGTPEFAAMARQALQNKINPFTQMRVQNPDGSETLQFMRPPSIPSAPVGGLIPIDDEEGGPSPLGSGGFPGSF
jgi:hypothetical protein